MGPRPRSSSIDKIPSLEFVVALLLLKSRPGGLSRKGDPKSSYSNNERRQSTDCYPKDYFHCLNSFVEAGARPSQTCGTSQHLNTAAYWKAEYERTESARLTLEAKIVALEKKVEVTKDNASLSSKTLRRRGGDGSSGSQTCNHKRQKVPTNTAPAASNRASIDENCMAFESTGSAVAGEGIPVECANSGKHLLHHFYLLQQTLAQRTPIASQLATTIHHTAHAICQIIDKMHLAQGPLGGADRLAHTSQVLGQDPTARNGYTPMAGPGAVDSPGLARIFSVILHATEELNNLSNDSMLSGRVVHSCTRIFKCLLDRISCIALADAETGSEKVRESMTGSQPRRKPSKCHTCKQRHLKCDQRLPACRYCKLKGLKCDRAPVPHSSDGRSLYQTSRLPTSSTRAVCDLTIALMKCLNTEKATDKIIMEGYLFLLYERIGKGLRHFVFNSETGASQNDNIQFTPAGVQAATEPEEEEASAIQAQAPALIYLLEHTQTLLPSQSRCPSTTTTAFARNKLQHTLLRSVFGAEASASFTPALEQPPISPSEAEMKEIEGTEGEVAVEDWYKHEVWRLLGWDVLSGHRWGE